MDWSKTLRTYASRYAVDIVLMVGVGILSLYIGHTSSLEQIETPFFERDPSISYPWDGKGDGMSTTTLALVSTLLPAMVILTTQCMVRYRKKESSLLDYLGPYLALCESIVLTNLVGETLKHYASDLRPNFLARCNYKGYRDAVASGNYTAYNAVTVAGQLGSYAFCLDTQGSEEGRKGFPSNHAAIAFAGLGFLSLFLFRAQSFHRGYRLLKAFVIVLPTFCAAIIGAARIRGGMHNAGQVVAGVLVGAVCAAFAWSINFKPREHKAERPYALHHRVFHGTASEEQHQRHVSDKVSSELNGL